MAGSIFAIFFTLAPTRHRLATCTRQHRGSRTHDLGAKQPESQASSTICYLSSSLTCRTFSTTRFHFLWHLRSLVSCNKRDLFFSSLFLWRVSHGSYFEKCSKEMKGNKPTPSFHNKCLNFGLKGQRKFQITVTPSLVLTLQKLFCSQFFIGVKLHSRSSTFETKES